MTNDRADRSAASGTPWLPEGLRQQVADGCPGVDDRARTERGTREVAVVEQIPVDAQQLGLTDLTAPGLAMVSNLNPDNHRQMRRLAWFVAIGALPMAVVLLGTLLSGG